MALIDNLFDKNNGNYTIPLAIIPPEWQDYMNSIYSEPDPKEKIQTTTNRVSETIKCAILDSGIMTHHPLIKDEKRIVEIKDFTGEGIEDESGHGTIVTLITLLTLPSDFNIEFYIGKVLDKVGKGYEEEILNGFRWAAKKGVDYINFSAGIERDYKCDGTCDFCISLKKISEENRLIIITAAGNKLEKYYCPAILDGKHHGIVATDSFSNSDFKRTTVYMPGEFVFVKI